MEFKTDKQKVIDLFDELGIGYKLKDDEYPQHTNSIKIKAGYSYNKVDGYGSFYTLFNFDENDKFVDAGIWE